MRVKLEQIEAFVKAKLSEKRFNHVLGVLETAKQLAKKHGVDIDDAAYAALAHDVAKEQPRAQTAAILRLDNEREYLKYSDKIWHAPMGAIVAKKTFLIDEVDVLNAIKYHTTGRPEMSDLEKVIFVADYTEPNRTFEGSKKVRELWDDLDQAVHEILKQKVEKVTNSGMDVHPDTLAAFEYYKELLK